MAAQAPGLVKALVSVPTGPVAFTGVRLFDADTTRFLTDQTVVVVDRLPLAALHGASGQALLVARDDAAHRVADGHRQADLVLVVGQPFDPWELRSVDFWVAVGTNDTNPAEVPRQFDPFQGDDRLDRAQAFVTALGALDVSAQLAVFPGVPHALTPAMEGAAIAFLADHSDPTA